VAPQFLTGLRLRMRNNGGCEPAAMLPTFSSRTHRATLASCIASARAETVNPDSYRRPAASDILAQIPPTPLLEFE
jgi:hypothetical protein